MTVIERPSVLRPVDYPDSDGSLIAESDWHRDELVDLIYRLKARYAARPDTYVSGHMLIYYEEGEPSSVFAPDVMVVFGVPNVLRGVYKLWEEDRAPAVVFEVSSPKTWLEDSGNKRTLCEWLGVAEYFLWDPCHEYLTPPLQGFHLAGGSYRQIRPDAAGCVNSTVLGLRLCPERNRLELYDRRSGKRLNRPTDAEAAARQAAADAEDRVEDARHSADIERAARERAEEADRERRELVAEVERLQAEVDRLRGEGRGPVDRAPLGG
jgi:Uma2 family endonuclease